MDKKTYTKINIGGLFFDNVTMNEALSLMEQRIKEYKGGATSQLCVANQDIINRIKTVEGLDKRSINESFIIIPDGYSIVAASRFLGRSLKERVTGPDIMLKFIERSEAKGYRHFFLGAAEGVAQKMIKRLLAKYPSLNISGYYSPPFGTFSNDENKKMIDMVNKNKTDILWVSFGCPKQEKWIIDNKKDIHVPITAGVGAAFDFISGNVKRAPLILQKMRLEWFYRLLQEPKRLWKRYLLGGGKFAGTIIRQKLRMHSQKENMEK